MRFALLAVMLSLLASPYVRADTPAAAPIDGKFYLQPGDTVLFFGDSITAETKYEWQLFNELGDKYPDLVMVDGKVPKYQGPVFEGKQIKFVCGGYSGFTAGMALPNLAGLIDKHHPTVAVVCFGMNDRYKDRKGYIKNMTTIIEQLKAAKCEVTVLSAPTVCPVHAKNLQPFVKVLGEMKDEVRKLAMDEKVGFVDWYTPTLKYINDTHKDTTWGDGIHPNLTGDEFADAALLQAWNVGAPLGKSGDPRPAIKSSPPTTEPAATQPAPQTNAEESQPIYLSDAAPGWTDVTGNVGGDNWGFAGVCLLSAVPGTDALIAGISEKGLWITTDRGATWKQMGAADAKEDQIDNRPSDIVYDPKNPAIFWETGCYGKGLFKTTDGGATFKRLGTLSHTDSIAIDFTDPQRKTILIGMHEKIRALEKSVDGGETWENIGTNMPENSNFDNEVLMIDKNTYVTNAAGWWPNSPPGAHRFAWGIFRTEDAGKTWTRLTDMGPGTHPLTASDGSIYWGLTWGGGVVRSADKGKTWEKLPGPVKNCPIELPGGKLVGWSDKQLYVSDDAGKSWNKFLDPMPWGASGIVYSEKGKCLYAWHSSGKKEVPAIERYDLTK